ncbi:MAG: cytochrome c biogenesis protein CcdA [Alphaproteobacteria bacterium]
MELAYPTLLTVPFFLGLLGFVEPCTIGVHLLFLRRIVGNSLAQRVAAISIFIGTRTLVMGVIGAVAALMGQQLLTFQSGLWLLFGALYLIIGIAYAVDRIGMLRQRLDVVPASWRLADNPALMGLAFGFSIPACAAPILVALFGLAAGSGAPFLGFTAMAVFGLGLSVPLIALAMFGVPSWLKLSRSTVRWLLAAVFVGVGLWSIWFGLYVDAAAWTI